MAVGLITEIPATTEQYDAINQKLGFPDYVPDGLLSHIAGPAAGGMRIVDVWESREDFDNALQGKLGDAIGEVMGADAPAPDPDEFPIHNRYPS